jgi:zinc transporter
MTDERHARLAPIELSEGTYGSDRHGLVWGFLFVRGEAPREIDSDGAAGRLGGTDREPTGSFALLHFSLSNVACTRWMCAHLELPDFFFESLQGAVGSTRLEQVGPRSATRPPWLSG